MHAMLLAFLAMVFYASEAVVTDAKLSHLNPRLLTFLYGLGIALFAGLSLVFAPVDRALIQREFPFVGMVIIASFLGALFHFSALNAQSGATALCSMYMLLPVAASIMKFLHSGQKPDQNLVIAWVLGAAALLFVTFGQQKPHQ